MHNWNQTELLRKIKELEDQNDALIEGLQELLPQGPCYEYEEGYADAIVAALSLVEKLKDGA